MYHNSRYANNLHCFHCEKINTTDIWPLNGDSTPLYYESESSEYSVEITCPYCGKIWFVVWDYDPGPLQEIRSDSSIGEKRVGSYPGSYDNPQLYLAVKLTVEKSIRSGVDSFDAIIHQASESLANTYDMEKLYPLLRRAWLELSR